LSSDLVVSFDDFFQLCFCCSLMGKSGKPFDNYPPHAVIPIVKCLTTKLSAQKVLTWIGEKSILLLRNKCRIIIT
jgi:hypothetical protein